MQLSDYLPLLGVVSGIFALYIDPKTNPRWRAPAIVGIFAAAIIAMCANFSDEYTKRLERNNDKLQSQKQLADEQKEFEDIKLLIMKSNGVRDPSYTASNPQESARIIDATTAKLQAIANVPEPAASGVTIEYFPHFISDVNPDTVRAALE
jgi:hypothetical protein